MATAGAVRQVFGVAASVLLETTPREDGVVSCVVCPDFPSGHPRGVQDNRTSPPARGRCTRARWAPVPIVQLHRVPTVGTIQRLFGARVSAEPPLPTSASPHCPGNVPLARPHCSNEGPPPKRRCSMLALARNQSVEVLKFPKKIRPMGDVALQWPPRTLR